MNIALQSLALSKRVRLASALPLALVVVFTVGWCNSVGAAPQEKKNYKIVLDLDDRKLSNLENNGFIKAPIPQKYQNKITAIVLKYNKNVVKKRLKVDGNSAKLGANLIVPLSSSLVDRLKYQPLELKVYAKGYTDVVLRLEGKRKVPIRQPVSQPVVRNNPQRVPQTIPKNGANGNSVLTNPTMANPNSATNPTTGQPKIAGTNPKQGSQNSSVLENDVDGGPATKTPVDPQVTTTPPKNVTPKIPEPPKPKEPVHQVNPEDYRYVRVEIDKGTDLAIAFDTLPVKDTTLGQIEVPVDNIDGIRFNVDDKGGMLVVLKNGDRITGTPAFEALPVYSPWGDDEVKVEDLYSVTPSRLQQFQLQESEGEKRWILKY